MPIYNKSGNAIYDAYSAPGDRLLKAYKADGTPIPLDQFLDTAILTPLPSINFSGNKQGACTDGEYLYQFMINSFRGIKYKISDGTYQTYSLGSSIPYNHGNDMAYNPTNNHIYVASMSSDGAVMELDTDFNYITTHYLVSDSGQPYEVWGLCFNQKTNQFFSLYGNSICVYDTNLNYIRRFPLPEYPNATGQGCETDGEYIYRVTYSPNLIDIATIDGAFVKTMDNPMSGEPETMMYDWIHDRYFMNKQTATDLFWQVQLKQANP